MTGAGEALAVRRMEPLAVPPLRLFASIPPDFSVHAVTDTGCLPLIAPGEVAVVTDQPLLYPETGGWYLVEQGAGTTFYGREKRVRSICLVYQKSNIAGRETWWAKSPAQRRRGIIEMSDGPHELKHITEKILGRVVGIHAPDRVAENPSDDELRAMLKYEPDWLRPYNDAMTGRQK